MTEVHQAQPTTLAMLPLRDVVVYPHMVLPLFVGREKSIAALNAAMEHDEPVFLLAQKNASTEEPHIDDMYTIGTVANVLQVLKLPDGTVKVLVEGLYRARVQHLDEEDPYVQAHIVLCEETENNSADQEALRRTLLAQFDQLAKLNKKIPDEVVSTIHAIEDNSRLADTITAHLQLKLEQKQEILFLINITARMEHLLQLLEAELDILQVEKRIRGRVKRQMEKSQREYYLNEQVKAIQKELGEGEDDLDALEKQIQEAGMSTEAEEKCMAEMKKLRMMPPMSAESTVVRNYIDTLLSLPWKKKSKISKNITKADLILNADHYGLDKVKERILEYLAVQKRMNRLKGPILCLVGPPGVGKTSLGQSIARATGRKYVRMALGGVHDESEIRGHRRTYIGSMPGKILQNLAKVGVKNPLFLLDEIDKMGGDFRGDPASALLEVLDPEQNHSFADHYAEVEFDLSDVMFIATSNSMNIPSALLDRMEIIRLSGYTEDEKINIAMQYLVEKQIKQNGLRADEIEIDQSAVRDIIRYYTREAGVRSLDREIAKICRKVVMQQALTTEKAGQTAVKKEGTLKPVVVNAENLHDYLGVRRFDYGVAESENRVGQVTGLAWTEVGGELLTIEASKFHGKGHIIRTGKLGDVMQESISAAWSVVRSRAESLGIEPNFYEKNDIHVHVPEGATPKDGPSAGSAITLAIVSAFTGIPVRADVAMTGEITLRGEVLPIGGLKEKLLAALRGGIKHVLIPKDNVKDLEEIPENICKELTIHPVQWIDEVLNLGLAYAPSPWAEVTKETPLPTTDRKSSKSTIKH
ncbi:endopeptidase La [Neisseriaceae bacterium ESL0693]|nr:endopeptidase La [Neisseriaceae bacterium ESL0693]